jgi:hypothetical protein
LCRLVGRCSSAAYFHTTRDVRVNTDDVSTQINERRSVVLVAVAFNQSRYNNVAFFRVYSFDGAFYDVSE